MKRSQLTDKQKLAVPCPTCAAAIGEQCKMYSGLGRRNEPHSERKYYVIQTIEHNHSQHDMPQMVIRASTSVGSDDIRHGSGSVDKSY